MNKIFTIAEIGINHNGDINIAKKLIDLAKKTGFQSVKFQKRDIYKVYSKDLLKQFRDSPWGKTQEDQKKGLEFSEDQYDEIHSYCKKKDIIWFASAWDLNSLNFLDKYNLNFNKIASAMIIDENFLEEVAKRKKYTFISTGMSTEANIDKAVEIFKKHNTDFEIMHCVSTYPLKPEDVNLHTINALKKKYKCKIGYSGHENGVVISLAACGMGLSSIERHITLDRTMYGSDQAASLEESGMRQLITSINKIELALGEEKLGHIFQDEIPIAKKLRAHIKIKK